MTSQNGENGHIVLLVLAEEGIARLLSIQRKAVVYEEVVARCAKHHNEARAERVDLRPSRRLTHQYVQHILNIVKHVRVLL